MPAGLVYPLQVVAPVVVVLVDPLALHVPPHVLWKEEKHGKAGGAGLAELDFEGVKDGSEVAT